MLVQDVVGLDVAVSNALAAHLGKCLSKLPCHLAEFAHAREVSLILREVGDTSRL